MTACTNHGGKARRVVTAALVGVLSVGTVPMVALATGATDGIETLAASDVTAFENSKIWLTGLSGDGENGYYTTATGENLIDKIGVNWIKTANNQNLDMDNPNVARDYKVEIVTVDESGTPGAVTNEVVNPGTYAVKVTAIDGVYKGGVAYRFVTVKPATFGTLTAYEIDPSNPAKVNDTELIYTGSELNIGVLNGSTPLTEGVDYTIKFIPSDTGTGNEGVEIKNAGTYYAVVDGIGIYEGQQETLGAFTVYAFNLSTTTPGTVTVLCDPVVGSDVFPGQPTTVVYYNPDNDTYTYLDPSLVKLDITNGGYDDQVFGDDEEYTVTALPAKSDGNVTGSKAGVKICKYDHAATIEYDDEAFPGTFTSDLSAKRYNQFSFWEIAAYNNADEKLDTLSVSVYDEQGYLVGTFDGTTEHNDLKNGTDWRYTPGDYTVKVVAGDSTNYTAGGTATCNVHIISGTIDADASVFFNYKNDKGQWTAVSSVETTYDGSDVMDRIQTVVKDADGKELDKGTDYTVTIKDAEGKVVKEIVNAGSYTVEISVSGYDVTGTTTLPVTVAKKSFDDVVYLASTHFSAVNSNYDYLPWRKGGVPVSDMRFAADVTDNFTVTILKDGVAVDEVTDEGVYTLHFEPKTDAVTDNFETPADFEFVCVKDGTDGSLSHVIYSDVAWSDHFADSVAWVTGRTYMTGYSDTNLFGGWDNITRADVVGTLYKMAGGDGLTVSNDLYDVLVGWKSFDDVDGNEYYGRALAWAKSVGIANGHDGKFRPTDTVTREEFAAFLANYAELFDKNYEAADEGALSEMPDAGRVSGWAKGSVAWAVENGIMGNGGSIDPSSAIIRGDVAGMIYNYAK